MGFFSFISPNHYMNSLVKSMIADEAAKTFDNCLAKAIEKDGWNLDFDKWIPPLGKYGSLSEEMNPLLIDKVMKDLQEFKLEGGQLQKLRTRE